MLLKGLSVEKLSDERRAEMSLLTELMSKVVWEEVRTPWLTTPNRYLGGSTPMDSVYSDGPSVVIKYLQDVLDGNSVFPVIDIEAN
jgi:hypothetical protein